MFRAPLCPSSGAHDDTKTYTNAASYIFTEPDGLCGNQRYRRELLMMKHNGSLNMLSLT